MTNSRINQKPIKGKIIDAASIKPLFIYFRIDPHIRVVAIMSEQKVVPQFTWDADTIWGISSEGLHWLKDKNKHNYADEEWLPKYIDAIDNYVDDLNGFLDLFQP